MKLAIRREIDGNTVELSIETVYYERICDAYRELVCSMDKIALESGNTGGGKDEGCYGNMDIYEAARKYEEHGDYILTHGLGDTMDRIHAYYASNEDIQIETISDLAKVWKAKDRGGFARINGIGRKKLLAIEDMLKKMGVI